MSPGEEKEAWKGWKDGRSGSCSLCEFMITAMCIVSHTCGSCLEFMSLRMAHGNAPERSSHKFVPLTSSYRHMALYDAAMLFLGKIYVLFVPTPRVHSIDCFFFS